MHRRDFLKGTLAASLVGGCSAEPRLGSARAAASTGAPNILVILVDEMRPPPGFPDEMSALWQETLPNMLALWNKSACFQNHFTAASDCSPSRGTLVTGMYAQQHWLLTTRTSVVSPSLQPAYPTYGTILGSLGYATTWIGKWHLSDLAAGDAGALGEGCPPATAACGGSPLAAYGFAGGTCPDPIGLATQGAGDDGDIAQQFVTWLQGAEANQPPQPWCTTVSFVNPHDIQWFWRGTDCSTCAAEASPPDYGWDNAYFQQLYQGAPCVNFENPFDPACPKPAMQQAFAAFTAGNIGAISWDPATLQPTMPLPSCTDGGLEVGTQPFNYWYKLEQLYLYLQGLVDQQIGVVLNALAASPFAGNTIVIFTSDHGEYAGAHGQRGKGGMAYDEGMRVPFSVYDPTGAYVASPGVVRTGLTSSADFTSLLATLANGGTTPAWHGKTSYLDLRFDMSTMLASPTAPGRPYVLYSTDESFPGIDPTVIATHVLSYRTADAKLNVYSHWQATAVTIDPTKLQEIELYDYGISTTEVCNVAGQAGELALQHAYMTALLGPTGQGGLVALELQAPVDITLRPAQQVAIDAYLAYTPPVAAF
jgi:arylsulfatase A-like enzyme